MKPPDRSYLGFGKAEASFASVSGTNSSHTLLLAISGCEERGAQHSTVRGWKAAGPNVVLRSGLLSSLTAAHPSWKLPQSQLTLDSGMLPDQAFDQALGRSIDLDISTNVPESFRG
jgi:hypothetical protein